MTLTADFTDAAYPHRSRRSKVRPARHSSPDVPSEEPAKPAKTQFKITLKPSAVKRSATSRRPSRRHVPFYESEVQRAARIYERSAVAALDRMYKNTEFYRLQQMMDQAFPRIPDHLLELERIQRLTDPLYSVRL